MNGKYLASGPLVWIVTIAITTLLLVASAKALFLVVPFLIAIILHYILAPIVHSLELRGISRETAAALVAGGVALLGIAVMIPASSWLVGQSVSSEEALGRYIEGGRVLLDRTLAALEKEFGFLQRMDFHAEVGRKAAEFGGTFMQVQLPQMLLKAAAQLPALLLAPFLAFFLLRDGHRFLRTIISGVPNAFFERTVYMFDNVHQKARSYFEGLLKLAAVDAVLYTIGLWLIGVSGAVILGILAALMSWIPVVGTAIACVMIVLAAAAAFPSDPWVVYASITMFLVVRLLDTFVIMPMTVGRSIQIHPLPTVLMLFIGGTVAGIPGLVLALPLAAVVSTIVGTVGAVIDAPRLRARHRFAKALEARRINIDLQ